MPAPQDVRGAADASDAPQPPAPGIGPALGGRKQAKRAAYIRQGDWFFLPSPRLTVSPALVRHHEPLPCGLGGPPHVAELCYAIAGEKLYVKGCVRHPDHKTVELRCWYRAMHGRGQARGGRR